MIAHQVCPSEFQLKRHPWKKLFAIVGTNFGSTYGQCCVMSQCFLLRRKGRINCWDVSGVVGIKTRGGSDSRGAPAGSSPQSERPGANIVEITYHSWKMENTPSTMSVDENTTNIEALPLEVSEVRSFRPILKTRSQS